MTLTDLEPSVSANGGLAKMNLDVWHLVFGQIKSRKDLCNICLTFRAWHTMAMPYLYKTVRLVKRRHDIFDFKRKKDLMAFARSLSSRLLDMKNEQLRNAVRELDFGTFEGDQLSEMEKNLVAMVDSLPNLQQVKINGQLTSEVLQELASHSKRVQLHLLGENGKRLVENDLQNVVALTAHVNPYYERDGPNRDMLGLQKLLFACPNLKSFSLYEIGGYGGCVISMPRYERIYSFQLSGDETFPPLEELSLSGYYVREAEREHWRNNFQWSKLRSLSLGPKYTAKFLQVAAGYAKSLQELTVEVYTDADRKYPEEYNPDEPDCPPLEEFLTTFTSLESLTVRGYHPSLAPIGNHPGLKHLCLHSFEPVADEALPRPTLSVEQLQELDKSCPHLETLEIDLYRDGEWPEHILKTLAAGFRNLRCLTLHLEVGLRGVRGMRGRADEETCNYVEPMLKEDSAKEVGQRFFKWRASPESKLSALVLKTGEPLRRYPQWEPGYSAVEKKNAYTMKVCRPANTGAVPKVVVVSKPHWRY
ncbi:hypothetical protein F5Y09DRAFT_317862 [Xylaria sp. FL1042]|nr:hypothetical protein F5Y09DRAFT_317862 [Xylaria sp. FL1042]